MPDASAESACVPMIDSTARRVLAATTANATQTARNFLVLDFIKIHLPMETAIFSRFLISHKKFTISSVEKCMGEDKLQAYHESVLSYPGHFCLAVTLIQKSS